MASRDDITATRAASKREETMAEDTEGTERTASKGTKKRFLQGSDEHKQLASSSKA
jgi:hypothetical protein